MQKLQMEIRKLTGQPLNNPVIAYGGDSGAPTPTHQPIRATSQHKIGFVDTDSKVKPAIKHDIPTSLPPLTISNTATGYLDLEGFTLEQLLQRRDDYKRMGGDNPTCPACNLSFPRRTWQDVFCCPEHNGAFYKQVKRLRRASKD